MTLTNEQASLLAYMVEEGCISGASGYIESDLEGTEWDADRHHRVLTELLKLRLAKEDITHCGSFSITTYTATKSGLKALQNIK